MSDETPPDLTEAAHMVYTALGVERFSGFLPELVEIAVYAVDNTVLHVHIGGLTDEFILGRSGYVAKIADIDPDIYFTSHAKRLRHRVEDGLRDYLPRKESGELWFAFHVWLMTEPFWRSRISPGDGVWTLGKGNPQ